MKQDVLNPMTWNRQQWKDALIGAALAIVVLGWTLFIMVVFH